MQKQFNMIIIYDSYSAGLDSTVPESIFITFILAIFLVVFRAQLIKLNIYPVGRLFKKHVDSPKLEAFGSLVVFLPCYFLGGDLIV